MSRGPLFAAVVSLNVLALVKWVAMDIKLIILVSVASVPARSSTWPLYVMSVMICVAYTAMPVVTLVRVCRDKVPSFVRGAGCTCCGVLEVLGIAVILTYSAVMVALPVMLIYATQQVSYSGWAREVSYSDPVRDLLLMLAALPLEFTALLVTAIYYYINSKSQVAQSYSLDLRGRGVEI